MKIVWLGDREQLVKFFKLYEWSFKILGWFTALAALKFAHVKTGDVVFIIIYAALAGLLNWPVFYSVVFHVHIDYLRSKSLLADRIIGRLPGIAILLTANYCANWAITYAVNEIVKVQATIACKP